MIDFNKYLSKRDIEVFSSAGFGKQLQLGSRPALLVIDVTYEFTGEIREPILESVKKIRTACGEQAWDAVDAIQKVIQACREFQFPVIYTMPERNTTLKFFDRKTSRGNEKHAEHLHEIVEQVRPLPTEQVFKKVPPSGFIGTNLLAYLISNNIDTLLVTGGTTSGCVRATAVDGFSYGFKVSLIEEALFDRGEMSHVMSIFDMQAKYCNLLSVNQAIEYLKGLR